MTRGNEKDARKVSTFWLKRKIQNFAIKEFEAEAGRLQH